MWEYTKKTIEVDGIEFDAYSTEITGANLLGVTVGTTGHRGGDSGHGGRTVLCIEDLGSTDINVTTARGRYGELKICIKLGGDSELDTLIEGLEFAVDVLKTIRKREG